MPKSATSAADIVEEVFVAGLRDRWIALGQQAATPGDVLKAYRDEDAELGRMESMLRFGSGGPSDDAVRRSVAATPGRPVAGGAS